MRLATYRGDRRDGRLMVVSDDLTRCVRAPDGIPTLQVALDDWDTQEFHLRACAARLAADPALGQPFEARLCESPLPRAFQWADGSAYINHVELVRRARGAEVPASFYTDPLMYQGGSDGFLAPTDDIPLGDPAWGCDLEAEVAVITGDVPMGVTPVAALEYVRLVVLVNDVSLRGLIPNELAKGFGFFQSKPASAMSPVAVTPDALGPAWRDGRLHGRLESAINGVALGHPDAGVDMTFGFGELIAHAARTRRLAAGTVIGSGTVSNRGADGGHGLPVAEGGAGYSCLAEVRTVETLRFGQARTPFMTDGDSVRIEMRGEQGQSLFGAIEQTVRGVAPG